MSITATAPVATRASASDGVALDEPRRRAAAREDAARLEAARLAELDQLLGAIAAHRVGQHAHALGRRGATRPRLRTGRRDLADRRVRARGRRDRLERVDHVLEVDRDDTLELAADGLVELGAAQGLEPELEHLGEHWSP